MNKKKLLILLCIVLVTCISILIIMMFNHNSKANKSEDVINEVDLKAVDNLIIGSEPPRIIYADKDRVIFDCCGVYVYDFKSKALAKTFDISASISKKYMERIWDCFATQDGKHIVFKFAKDSNGLVSLLDYSFQKDIIKEITEEEFNTYKEKAFICTRLEDSNDELYQKSSGTIAKITDSEYVYLTFKDWKVDTIEAVYVKNGKDTIYKVFAKK